MKRYLASSLFFLTLLALVPTEHVAHQTGLMSGITPAAELALSPAHPNPLSPVTIRLQDYTYNSTGATINWLIDGVSSEAYANQREISLNTKAAGESTTVVAITRLPSGATVRAETVITPVQVDFLVEANTLTPTFYHGRALPTAGSQVRVTAVPFLGATTNPSNYSYRWEVKDDVVDGGAVRGKNATMFRSQFETSMPITVSIYDTAGNLLTRKQHTVAIEEAEIYFYERNPLRGLLPVAIQSPQPFLGQEMTIRAEPYFYDHPRKATYSLNGRLMDKQLITSTPTPLKSPFNAHGQRSFRLGLR